MSERCVQCQWTIAPSRYDDVHRNGERIALHKGGCPTPSAQSKEGAS